MKTKTNYNTKKEIIFRYKLIFKNIKKEKTKERTFQKRKMITKEMGRDHKRLHFLLYY